MNGEVIEADLLENKKFKLEQLKSNLTEELEKITENHNKITNELIELEQINNNLNKVHKTLTKKINNSKSNSNNSLGLFFNNEEILNFIPTDPLNGLLKIIDQVESINKTDSLEENDAKEANLFYIEVKYLGDLLKIKIYYENNFKNPHSSCHLKFSDILEQACVYFEFKQEKFVFKDATNSLFVLCSNLFDYFESNKTNTVTLYLVSKKSIFKSKNEKKKIVEKKETLGEQIENALISFELNHKEKEEEIDIIDESKEKIKKYEINKQIELNKITINIEKTFGGILYNTVSYLIIVIMIIVFYTYKDKSSKLYTLRNLSENILYSNFDYQYDLFEGNKVNAKSNLLTLTEISVVKHFVSKVLLEKLGFFSNNDINFAGFQLLTKLRFFLNRNENFIINDLETNPAMIFQNNIEDEVQWMGKWGKYNRNKGYLFDIDLTRKYSLQEKQDLANLVNSNLDKWLDYKTNLLVISFNYLEKNRKDKEIMTINIFVEQNKYGEINSSLDVKGFILLIDFNKTMKEIFSDGIYEFLYLFTLLIYSGSGLYFDISRLSREYSFIVNSEFFLSFVFSVIMKCSILAFMIIQSIFLVAQNKYIEKYNSKGFVDFFQPDLYFSNYYFYEKILEQVMLSIVILNISNVFYKEFFLLITESFYSSYKLLFAFSLFLCLLLISISSSIWIIFKDEIPKFSNFFSTFYNLIFFFDIPNDVLKDSMNYNGGPLIIFFCIYFFGIFLFYFKVINIMVLDSFSIVKEKYPISLLEFSSVWHGVKHFYDNIVFKLKKLKKRKN